MNNNIELQYLSCLLHNIDLIEKITIKPFQLSAKNAALLDVLVKLYDSCDLLDEHKKVKYLKLALDANCSEDYIKTIYKTESSKLLFNEYETVIKNNYIVQKSKEIASELDGIKTLEEYSDIIKRAESYITNRSVAVSNTKEMLKAYEDSLKERTGKGVAVPYTLLSQYVNKFYPGQYIVIGGRPSKGKSAFMLSLLRRLSCPVGIVSLETTTAEITARLIAQQAHIALDIVSNNETQFVEQRVSAMSRIYEKELYVYDKSSKWSEIRSAMREMVKKYKCKVIGIDYVQLINMGEGRDRVDALGELSRECKEFARRNECTVISLAQLGRAADDGRPKLKDLQWSSQLEQDADVVMLIHEQDGKNTIQIEKNRDGRTGEVEMVFEKFCVDWTERDFA